MKSKLFLLLAVLGIVCLFPSAYSFGAPVAKIGDTEYETLPAAFADVSKSAPLTWVDDTVWPDATPVYYDGNFFASISAAITAANTANAADPALIYVKPNFNNGCLFTVAHDLLKTSITIYGNNASVNGGWEPSVELNGADNPANGTHVLTKSVQHCVYNLHDGMGFWGQRCSAYVVDITMENCQNVHEFMINGSGSPDSICNYTIKNCTFDQSGYGAPCPITTTTAGTITVEDCTFTGFNNNYVFNINNKNGGEIVVNAKNLTFTNCGASGKETFRLTGEAAGSSIVATIDNVTFSPSLETGDIIIGHRTASKNNAVVSYSIVNTAANMVSGDRGTAAVTVSAIEKSATAITGSNEPTPTPKVATVGDTEYETLAEAVAALNQTAGQTLTLLADVEITAPIVISKNAVIDLGGFSLTSSGRAITVNVGVGSLELRNGAIVGGAGAIVYGSTSDASGAQGVITLDNVDISATGGDAVAMYAYKGSFALAANSINTIAATGSGCDGIYVECYYYNETTISGSGELTVSGANAGIHLTYSIPLLNAPNLKAYGAAVGGFKLDGTGANNVVKGITAGMFSNDVAANCVDGYACISSGDATYGYQVVDGSAYDVIVTVNGSTAVFDNIADAIAAAGNDTVWIIVNNSLMEDISVGAGQTVVIDAGTSIIDGTIASAGKLVILNGDFTSDPTQWIDDGKEVVAGGGVFTVQTRDLAVEGDNAFHLRTLDDLCAFRNMVNDGAVFLGETVVLEADIDMSGLKLPWVTIGNSDFAFAGCFDGGGKKIVNLTFVGDAENIGGLFCDLKEGSEVRDLKFIGADISGYHAAALAAHAYSGSVIDGVVVDATSKISATSYAAGIIARVAYGDMYNCWNYADVESGFVAAGIAGYIYGEETDRSQITNCVNKAATIVGVNRAGGIVAHANYADVSWCCNTATVEQVSGSMPAGGIVAVGSMKSVISYCLNVGPVKSGSANVNASAGGILGQDANGTATTKFCDNWGDVTASQFSAGGVVMSLYGTTVNHCRNSGTVNGAVTAGGISAKPAYGASSSSYCVVDAAVAGGTTYRFSSQTPTSGYYYDGDILKTVSGTGTTAAAAVAALNDAANEEIDFWVVGVDGRVYTILMVPEDQIVYNATQKKFYGTIQAAITAATANDAIEVPVGIFDESLIVSKPLTLSGAGDTVTIVDGDVTLDVSGITITDLSLTDGKRWIVTPNAAIQDAIDAVTAGDTVAVQTGTYTGNIDATAKSIKLAAGASPGQVVVTGDMILTGDDTLEVEIDGGTAGSDYDQWVVNGAVTLGGATLDIVLGYQPLPGTSFVIIDNDSSDAVNGTFAGLAEGATFDIDGLSFGISYVGGDGNDVVLTVLSPSTVYVDENYTPGSCDEHIWGYNAFTNIQQAVDAVVDGGTVNIAAGTYVENVYVYEKNLDIIGAGAAATIVDGNAADSVFFVEGDIDVAIMGLTIQNGGGALATYGAGVYAVATSYYGDGLFLSLVDCWLKNNTAATSGGGLATGGLNEHVTLIGTTISGNTASGKWASNGGGGAFIYGGSLTMQNCTVSGNTAVRDGGGIFITPNTLCEIDFVTATGNTAARGGGLSLQGAVGAINNTIVCGNTATADNNVFGAIPTPGGAHNLINQDAMLGALADNGGPTPTHALLTGSPAINGGVAGTATYDQRGVPRDQGNAPDIGAYETVRIVYVDDDWTGPENVVGHAWGQDAFSTLTAALAAVPDGGVVRMAAGTYEEIITVNKRVSVIGAGSGTDGTILTAASGGDTTVGVVNLTASGLSNEAPILLKDLRIQPVQRAGISVGEFGGATGTTVEYVKLDNVKVYGTNASPSTEQERGLYVDVTSTLKHLVVTDCAFDNLTYGWYFHKQVSADTSTVQDVAVLNTSFSHNNHKGIYAEKLSDATFTGCTIADNGFDGSALPSYFVPWMCGVDLNLKAGTYTNFTFDSCAITGNALGGAKEGVGITIKARDDGGYATFPAACADVLITGCTITGNERGVRIGEPGKSNAGPTGVVLENNVIADNVKTYTGTDGSAYGGVINVSQTQVVANGNYWGEATPNMVEHIAGDVTVDNYYAAYDAGVFSDLRYLTVYVDSAADEDATHFKTLAGAVAAVAPGGTIHVAAGGTYNESVTLEKPVSLIGPATGEKPLVVGMITATHTTGWTTRIENIDFKVNATDKNNLKLVGVKNLTVKGCDFDADERFMALPQVVAVQLDGACQNITFEDCTFHDGYYVTIQGRADNLLVKDCDIENCKSGINIQYAYGAGLILQNTDISVVAQGAANDTYCVRFGSASGSAENLSITDGDFTVDTNGLTPDAGTYFHAIVVREAATGTLAVTGTTINGEIANLSATPLAGVDNLYYVVYVDDDYTAATSGWGAYAFASIQDALTAVQTSGTVHVAAGTYTQSVTVNKPISLVASGDATIIGTAADAVTVAADGVRISGFTVQNPNGLHGIYALNRNHLTVSGNIIEKVGTGVAAPSSVPCGVMIYSTIAAVDDVLLTGNVIRGIESKGNKKSANGIWVGDSAGNFDIANLVIQGNVISNIVASPNTFEAGGRGAYGIIINHAISGTGRTLAPSIKDNLITDLEGVWAHAVGLEGNTPDAVVQGNTIARIIDHKSPAEPDAVGIMVEDNLAAADVLIVSNRFSEVLVGVRNDMAASVTANANYWGSATPDIDSLVLGDVVTDSFYADEALTDLRYYVVYVDDSFDTESGNRFKTIQGGVDAVSVYGTVNVAAGSYGGATLTKSVKLLGANAGVAGYGTRADEAVITSVINMTGKDTTVMIDGFKFNVMPHLMLGANNAESKQTADWTFQNNLVEASGAIYSDTGYDNLNWRDVVVTRNRFVNMDSNAVSMFNVRSLTATDNQFDTFGTGHNALVFQNGGSLTVAGNSFSNIGWNAVQLVGATSVTITNNICSNLGAEAFKLGGPIENGVCSYNTIIGANTTGEQDVGGIRIRVAAGQPYNVEIIGNYIENSFNGIAVRDDDVLAGTAITVAQNTLVNNSKAGIYNGGTAALAVSANYWGTEFGPSGTGFFGTGDAIIGPVDIESYYTDAALTTLHFYDLYVDDSFADDDLDSNHFRTIQAAYAAANPGDTIHVAAGTYAQTSTLTLAKPGITVTGASRDDVKIDVSACGSSWGIRVKADDVTLEHFTVIPQSGTGGGYPIHVANTPGTLSNITLRDIKITGSYLTPFDFNGVDNLVLDGLVASGAVYGSGIGLTGCAGVTITGCQTADNDWGGVRVSGSTNVVPNRPSSDVNVDFTANTFAEVNALYIEDDELISTVNATGYSYKLTTSAGKTAYLEQDYTEAQAIAVALAAESTYPGLTVTGIYDEAGNQVPFDGEVGTAIVYVDDDWTNVVVGAGVQKPGAPDGTYLQFGRNAFATVQGGVTGVDATGTVYVAAGTYAEAFTIAKPVTVLGPNDNISPNAGERVAEAVLQGSTASGLSECVALDSTGVVLRGLTFDNLRIDSYNDNAHEQITGDVIAFNRFVNVLGTPIYLRDGRNEPGKYSTGVVVQDNYIDSPASAGSADFNAGSGIIVMGAEALVIKDNVILSAAYNGIQLGRCNGVVLQNNTATGCAQPALQIAQWNDGAFAISGNTFSTLSTTKAAVRLYGFTNNYNPLFTFTDNTIRDSKYGVQIGREDAGKGYNDIRDADYAFSGNTFANIESYRLLVYLSTAATAAEREEMDALFAQTYAAGSMASAITTVDPFTYVAVPNPVWVDDSFTAESCDGHIWGYDAFTTIQAGVNAVTEGGTVHVLAGTYSENVALDKPLTLAGSVDDKPLLVGMITGTYTDGLPTSIENIDFKVNADDKYNLHLVGVTNLTVKGCAFNADGRFLGDPNAVAVQLDTQKTCQDITIDGCTFTNGYYVAIQGWADNLLVKDCLIDNCKSGVNVQHASGAGATVTNCEINVVAQGVANDTYCVRFGSKSGLAQNLNIAGGVFTVDRNGLTPDADTYFNAVIVRKAASGTLALSQSSIQGGVVNLSETPLTAENNWFGSATGPTSDLNVGGTGDAVTGDVDFSPWLGDGTDTQPEVIGFQPNLTPVYYLPASLAFTQQPGDAALGADLNPQPVVTVYDEIDQIATQFVGTVTLALEDKPGGGTLGGTATDNAVAGVVTFTDLFVGTDGGAGYTLLAAAGSLSVESEAFTIANPQPVLTAMDPIFKPAGSGEFTLTVTGSDFVPSSTVMWNGSVRPTTYASGSELRATIGASDVQTAGTALVTVQSPTADASGALTFTITATAQASEVWVDDDWSGYGDCGDGLVWGYNAFKTIQSAVTAVAVNGKVNIRSGTYAETFATNKISKIINYVGVEDGNGGGLPTVLGSISINAPTTPDAASRIENIHFKSDGVAACLTLQNIDGGVTVSNCTFNGDGKFKNAIDLDSGGNGNYLTVEDSVFTNGFYLAINGTAKEVTVRRTLISGTKSGINMQSGATDLVVEDCDITVSVQSATNSSYGVRFSSKALGAGHNLTITGSRIAVDPNGFEINPAEHRAIWVRAGASGTLQVANNLIDGYVANDSTGILDASGNWWGSADAADVAGNVVAGSVDYSPWLAVGTDTDGGALGFKGDFSALYVDDGSVQAGTAGGIQEGIDLVATNGTVNVLAGTYNESVALDKPLTLTGPAAGDKPLLVGMITGTYTGGSATLIENIDFKVNADDKNNLRLVGVTNLTVKGCAFNADGRFLGDPNAVAVQLDTQKTCQDITIDGCTFTNGYYVAIQGWADNLLVKDCLIDNCKSGINIQYASGAGLTVTNSEINVVAQGAVNDTYCVRFGSKSGLAQSLNIAGGVFTVDRNGLTPDADTYFNAVIVRAAASGTLALSQSSIQGGVVNLSETPLTAENNWFGSVTGPTSTLNAGGTGDAVIGSVDFSPWLGDGTDTQPEIIGFQPNLTPVYYLPAGIWFSTEPAGALLGAPLGTQPVITVTNEIGEVATQFNGSVTLAIGNNPGEPVAGELSGTVTLPVANGVAAFSDLAIIKGTGNGYTLVASTEGLPAVTSTAFDIENSTPVLAPIGNQTVDEEALLTFPATATDTAADLVAQTLTFSLSGEVPDGASITTNGVFTWTPTEEQGGADYTFTVVVTDNGTGELSGSETITITVNEVNVAPTLQGVPTTQLSVDEQPDEALTFTATATDQDRPAQTLTFSLVAVEGANYPTDAEIVTTSTGVGTAEGAFSWEPTEEQGGMTYVVDVVVTDDGEPTLATTQRVTIVVNEVNREPELAPIPPQSVNFGQTLTFKAEATDQDLPEQTLTYTMTGGPEGATLDSSTGVFTWTPTEEQAKANYSFTIKVTDSGDPVLSDEQTVTIGAISAAHSCPGYWSPSISMVVSNTFAFGGTLTNLTWTPVLPNAGWVITAADAGGNGVAEVNSDGTAVVFTTLPTASPVVFTYTVSVPGDQAVSNSLGAVVSFSGLSADVAPIAIFRYHSADYRRDQSGETAGQFRKIDSTEINRVLSYWRFGYKPDAAGYDGFSAVSNCASTATGYHSADVTQDWVIDVDELLVVQSYWRGGGYHVDLTTDDGYAANRAGIGPSLFALAGIPVAGQTAPSGYNPGETLQVTYTLDPAGASLLALSWVLDLPDGWVIEGVSGDAAPTFTRNEIVCNAAVLPASTATVTVTLRVPLTEIRTATLGGTARLIAVGGRGVERYAMEAATLAPVDEDNNGMADSWERAFAGDAGTLDPAADLDGDTMSNLNEYLCGTLPNDAESVLKMVAVQTSADGAMQVSWASVAGRTYTLQRADGSPAAANFKAIQTGIAADPSGRNVYIDRDADGSQARFYRVVLED